MNAVNIDNQIANARENLRRLIDQTTADSRAADDALISERIPADHPSAGDSFRRGLFAILTMRNSVAISMTRKAARNELRSSGPVLARRLSSPVHGTGWDRSPLIG